MWRSRNLTIIPKYFQIKSCQKYLFRFINGIRPGNSLNNYRDSKLTLLKPHKFVINSRLLYNKLNLDGNEDQENFFQILMKIGNQNDLSTYTIKTIVLEMHKSLHDVALEKEHEKELLQSESFLKLLKAVEESIHEMEVNDIVKFLDLCKKLHMVHKIKSISNILRKVKDDSESLTLANEFKFSLMLNDDLMTIDKELIINLRRYFMMKTEKAIKNKLYRNSPEDAIAALQTLPLLKKLSIDDRINVLYSILDLKNWNNAMIFKFFLNVSIPSEHPLTEDIKEKFLDRMKKEISGNSKYLSDFLVGYSKSLKKSFIDYNKDLIDASINQILTNTINTLQIRKICSSLSELSHCHYQFVEYLIDFLEQDPGIYSSHPAIFAHIIETIANSNCNYEEKNRWTRVQPIVKNISNLSHVFELRRNDSQISYLYFLTQLASLGIFVDEELNFLREFLMRRLSKNEDYFNSWNTRMLITNFNSAVKALHPSFSEPILNDSHLSLVMNKLFLVHEESRSSLYKLDSMLEIRKCLESSSGVTNCILLNCMNKFGFVFDGLIGINKEGKLFDFKTSFKKNKKVFIEDVRLPDDYDLVALHLVTASEQSKNTYDLKAASSLRLKITEGLGFRTVIVYDSLWKSLKDEEKEKYLYMLQG